MICIKTHDHLEHRQLRKPPPNINPTVHIPSKITHLMHEHIVLDLIHNLQIFRHLLLCSLQCLTQLHLTRELPRVLELELQKDLLHYELVGAFQIVFE